MTLFTHAGFAMLTVTVKKSQGKFLPVGEKELVSSIQKPEGWITVIVDEDGFAKAQSKVITEEESKKILQKAVEAGVPQYLGEVKLV